MSTNVPYHLSNRKLHTMSTISPNLLQTAYNVYDLPQPTTVCMQYLQSSPTNNGLHTIATIILNQQQTACNVHNLAQPTTYNIQCQQISHPTADCIQCLQSSSNNYIQHTMSTIIASNQQQTAYNVYNLS